LIKLAKSFAQYLENQIAELKINLLAEELSEEAISKNVFKAKGSTAWSVANKLRIDHRFCDPDATERKTLGIPSEQEIRKQLGLGCRLTPEELGELEKEKRKYWSKREKFWMNRIEDKLNERVIFICGSEHTERFKSLTLSKGCETKILIKNWCEQRKGI